MSQTAVITHAAFRALISKWFDFQIVNKVVIYNTDNFFS